MYICIAVSSFRILSIYMFQNNFNIFREQSDEVKDLFYAFVMPEQKDKPAFF